MSQTTKTSTTRTRRQILIDAVEHMEHVLPGQAPLKDFVHHNTLHGYQHLKFADAIAAAKDATGITGFESIDTFREYFKTGRINLDDLNKILETQKDIDNSGLIYSDDQYTITHQDIYVTSLCTALPTHTGYQLGWQIEENKVLDRFDKSVSEENRKQLSSAANTDNEKTAINDLWSACTEVLEIKDARLHPEELIELTSDQAEQMILRMVELHDETHDAAILNKFTEYQAEQLLQELLSQVGTKITIRQLLKKLTGKDSLEEMRQYIVRLCSSYLDQGFAAWHIPGMERGLISAWKELVKHDPQFNLKSMDSIAQDIDDIPDDAYEIIELELQFLGIPVERWENYLNLVAQEIPGWSGMLHWRHRQSQQSQTDHIRFEDYLAIRLVLERLYAQGITRSLWRIDISIDVLRWYFRTNKAEYIVRYLSHNTRLPEYLHQQVERLLDHGDMEKLDNDDWQDMATLLWTWRMRPTSSQNKQYSAHRHAWPLFLIMQHLGICGTSLRLWSKQQVSKVFECIDLMQSDYGQFIWLQAYEIHYRDQVLTAISQNEQRGVWHSHDNLSNAPISPQAQVVFCMDDREEGFRRHLEAINPNIETLGAAGFFAVAMDWKGVDDKSLTPLCPIVVTPAHEVHEVPRAGQEKNKTVHDHRQRFRISLKQLFLTHTRRNFLSNILLITASAPFAMLSLLSKSFLPGWWARLTNKLKQHFDKSVETELLIHAETTKPENSSELQLGFTNEEMATRVAGFLKTIGVVNNFSPLIILMGHGSSSVNNPHLAAYDCGACSGRHGGPNARAFADMANRPAVRKLLAKQGLNIPESTWFIGAEHNTGNEEMLWFDMHNLPATHQNDLQQVQTNLKEAQRHSAHERTRRLASAPDNPSLNKAHKHVVQRGVDFSQARPELGHATNAAAIIGRRSISQGVFFDRRTFLISYDPTIDPGGLILENILLNAGPVGAGISLEYYFSTVNNEDYGCGSKITHNIVGNFSILDGTRSDLRTGLPKQMVEIHEAMRLQVIVESKVDIVAEIYKRQPPLQELIGNGWLLLSVKDYENNIIHTFDPDTGFTEWQAADEALPMIAQSRDWYLGHSGPRTPALLKKPASDQIKQTGDQHA